MDDIDKKYNVIAGYDKLAAEVWRDKQYFLTHDDIAKYRNMSVSQSKTHLQRAKYILKHEGEMWTWGLSNRAKFALLKRGYKNFKQFIEDLDEVELEAFDGVGEVVADEIKRWVKTRQSGAF